MTDTTVTLTLPSWLSITDKGVFRVERDAAYAEVMAGLGYSEKKLDQHKLEVVFQCTKMEVQRLVKLFGLDPRPSKSLVIDIAAPEGGKDRYALANFREGLGIARASKGGEAKRLYQAWRGVLPQ